MPSGINIRNASDPRDEVEHVRDENEEEEGHEKRKILTRLLPALEDLRHEIIDILEHALEEKLEPRRDELRTSPNHEPHDNEKRHGEPCRDETVRYRNSQKRAEFFSGKRYVNTAPVGGFCGMPCRLDCVTFNCHCGLV